MAFTTAFWTSNSALINGLTGYSSPSVVRIKGSLSATEAATVTKLSLFFTNLNAFSVLSDIGKGSPEVSCSSSIIPIKCILSNGDSTSDNFLL